MKVVSKHVGVAMGRHVGVAMGRHVGAAMGRQTDLVLDASLPKHKNYQTLDIVQTWEGGGRVSGPAKLFFEKRYGHVLRGEGDQRASSK